MRPIHIAQRLRREREKQAKIIQSQPYPFQPRFFPGLIPRPSKRAAYERDCIAIKNHFYQHPPLLKHTPSDPNRIPPVPILPPQGLHSTNSNSMGAEILLPPNNIEHIHDSRNIISSSMPTSPTIGLVQCKLLITIYH